MDNLPQRWKKLSPINRFKDKLKAEKEKIRELNKIKFQDGSKKSRNLISQSVDVTK